jgi:hypothetical protein
LTLLLEEEQRRGLQAREILLLSYTADLGFFETFALGVARACGARITLVGDARMTAADPRAARNAGRTYLAGNAYCEGAFHPKLVIIAGPERATIAIGSGNVTMAGWQANAELWTVIRGNRASCPSVLLDIARWLADMPSVVQLSRCVPEACARATDELIALVANATITEMELQLVTSTTGAIRGSLPTGPVDELAVCAPFHDPGSAALRALADHFEPTVLRISYQPGLTALDQPALQALTAELSARGMHVMISEDTEGRYRHGKLIEWSAGGARWALTGSPNLSSSALLESVAEGGNCELGIIAPIPSSLLPAGDQTVPGQIRALPVGRRRESRSALMLLGATRVDGPRLHIELVRPLAGADGHVDLSAAAAPPEDWERVADVSAGVREHVVQVAAEGGSRVRVGQTGADGILRHSNTVYVLDPRSASQRASLSPATPAPRIQPADLFRDPRLAERFFADMATLAAATAPPSRAVAAAGQSTSASTERADEERGGWQHYLDLCAGRVGQPLLRFALGLVPELDDEDDSGVESKPTPVNWIDDLVSDREPGLDGDTADEAADQHLDDRAVTLSIPDLTDQDYRVRRTYQRGAERLAAAAISPRLGLADRMLATRLILWIAAAGAWKREERTWIKVLAQAAGSLGSLEPPSDVEPQVGSLAAVALSVLRSESPRYEHTEETIAFDRTAEDVAHLLSAADPAYVEEYTKLLAPAFGSAVTPEVVLEQASDIVQKDPVADAVWSLVALGRAVHRHGDRILHVTGRFSNPQLVALEAVGAAEDAPLVAAWASSSTGPWALCIWKSPDLFTIDFSTSRERWLHHRFTSFTGLRAVALQRGLESATRVDHGPQLQPIGEAVETMQHLGLTSPVPPSHCE